MSVTTTAELVCLPNTITRCTSQVYVTTTAELVCLPNNITRCTSHRRDFYPSHGHSIKLTVSVHGAGTGASHSGNKRKWFPQFGHNPPPSLADVTLHGNIIGEIFC
ncbi:hypothetical protein BaRGS_00031496 [Batillaria attramentaria]|uniref:Uncharacterized protein n=1 Tax=Batillaria attramentaria TaxID=370345 RepID=A0ABD0JQG0_9CAEN